MTGPVGIEVVCLIMLWIHLGILQQRLSSPKRFPRTVLLSRRQASCFAYNFELHLINYEIYEICEFYELY
jgi:hypothetical protein